ncbi:MAG: D-alanine--D-alanine ligase family protein [Patescibacteria group bacterium]
MTNKKIRVAVLFGGRSGEHEVSLVSASAVIDNLDKEKYEVIPIGITKEGRWIAGPESMKLLKSGEVPKESNVEILAEPSQVPPPNPLLSKGGGTGNEIESASPPVPRRGLRGGLDVDVIFPVLHGPYGEDGTVQGFLELTGLPYVGCGVLASAVAMDKVMQKKVFAAEGLSQVPYVWFWRSEWGQNQEKYILEIEKLGYPVFVKPANLGSSVGINKAHNREELLTFIAEASAYDRKVLVEKGVENAREIECSVLGNQEVKASLPGEIIPSNEFYDYDAKYVDGKSAAKIPADLTPDMVKTVQETAIRAFRALSGEGLARVDFFLTEDNKLYVNEANTMPGFTSISMYPKLWEATGLGYSALLDELINLALARSQEKQSLKISYEPKAAWYAV